MPEIKPGETEKEWIPRCVSYLRTKEGKTKEQALGKCYGMWKQKHPEANDAEFMLESELFTCTANFVFEETHTETTIIEGKPTDNDTETRTMIAVIGNRFMNGGFLPIDVLKQSLDQWKNTLHDINHMGYIVNPMTDNRQDIRFFVGYHPQAYWNEDTNSISMNIAIVDSTMYASAWRGYVNLCKQAGIVPNVSVTYIASRRFIKAKDLPQGVDYAIEGYNAEDYVPILTGIKPLGVSTVVIGKCNDKLGCGIINTKCSCDVEDKEQKQTQLDAALEAEKNELLKRIATKEKLLKGE